MRPRFSRKGEAPTPKELALLAEALSDPCPTSPWLIIAQRIGVEALCVVFDELGSEKIHIPTRERFFEALWRPERNRAIAEAVATGRHPDDVAAEFGVDRTRVAHIVREVGR